MALITGTALVAIVWQGAVRIVGSKLAKELVKAGARHLTKKNFKKSYEFFKGNTKIKTSEKNKILEDLNIVTPKVKKVDTKAADKGDKIVEEVIKPTKTQKVLEQTKNLLLPKVLSKRGLVQYPGYYFGGKYILDKDREIKMKEATDAIERVKQKNLEDEKKLHKTKTEETTLGEIDLNTLASPDGHIWKTDQSGNFVLP